MTKEMGAREEDIEAPKVIKRSEVVGQAGSGKLSELGHPPLPNVCIYQVPPMLREINSAAHTPQVISIGPFHHGSKRLGPMELHKKRYLVEFCKRKNVEAGSFMGDVSRIIEEHEDAVRDCYSADSNTSCGVKFVEMIALDAVFILELFMRYEEEPQDKQDFIMGKPWLRDAIELDLILLENQLPYFILDKVYNFAFPNSHRIVPSLLELTCNFFSYYPHSKIITEKPLHFTDLIRYFWCLEHPAPHKSIRGVYNVTKLREAGVKFKTRENASLLDIRFHRFSSKLKSFFVTHPLLVGHLRGAVLEIPCLEVDDSTECVIRNLMALEQCHYPYEAYICNYVMLLNFLINTSQDVDVLIESKIIVNGLGTSGAVAELVNKLSKQITVVNSCYYPLAIELNEHYESYRHSPVVIGSKAFFRFQRTIFAALVVAALMLIILRQYQRSEFVESQLLALNYDGGR